MKGFGRLVNADGKCVHQKSKWCLGLGRGFLFCAGLCNLEKYYLAQTAVPILKTSAFQYIYINIFTYVFFLKKELKVCTTCYASES